MSIKSRIMSRHAGGKRTYAVEVAVIPVVTVAVTLDVDVGVVATVVVSGVSRQVQTCPTKLLA